MTKNLVSLAINKFYKRDPDAAGTSEEYVQVCELVIIGDEAEYVRSNDGEIIRQRKLSSHKFLFEKKSWPKLRDLIDTLVNADENDIHEPSHLCDADIAFQNMDDYDFESTKKANESFAKAESALREFWSAISSMDECPIRAAELERLKR